MTLLRRPSRDGDRHLVARFRVENVGPIAIRGVLFAMPDGGLICHVGDSRDAVTDRDVLLRTKDAARESFLAAVDFFLDIAERYERRELQMGGMRHG